jgi:hypothetical protein
MMLLSDSLETLPPLQPQIQLYTMLCAHYARYHMLLSSTHAVMHSMMLSICGVVSHGNWQSVGELMRSMNQHGLNADVKFYEIVLGAFTM